MFPPRYSTTNLNFSSLESSNAPPVGWTNGSFTFGSTQPQESIYHSFMKKPTTNVQHSLHQDTIEAATRVITSDPKFQSALQAALASVISGGEAGGGKSGQAAFPVISSFPSMANKGSTSVIGKSIAASSIDSRAVGSNSLMCSSSRSKSTSPETSRDEHVV